METAKCIAKVYVANVMLFLHCKTIYIEYYNAKNLNVLFCSIYQGLHGAYCKLVTTNKQAFGASTSLAVPAADTFPGGADLPGRCECQVTHLATSGRR